MENRAVTELLSAVKRRLVEQKMYLGMVRSMQHSAKQTAREFKKNHRRIVKGSAFYKYYEAKLAYDDKESKELKIFAGQLAQHVKKTRKMLSTYESPYFRYFKAYKRAEHAFYKRDKKLKKLYDRLAQRESLNFITPEPTIYAYIAALKEREKVLTQAMLIYKANNTNEKGSCQKLTNDFVAKLQAAFQQCLDFEKRFFKHAANIDSISIFYQRVQEIDKTTRNIDVMQTSNTYFNDVLKIQEVVRDAVFDTETIKQVKYEQRKYAEMRKYKHDGKTDKDITVPSSQLLSGDEADAAYLALPRQSFVI